MYTSTLAMRSLRILGSIANKRRYAIISLDAINAFLLSELSIDERFLIRLLPELDVINVTYLDNAVAELQLPLYRLRIAPKK